MKDFLKMTIAGGMLFLVPVAVVLFILGHALRLAAKFVQPISDNLHLDHLHTIGGVGVVTILAVLVLVLVSFVAGIVAQTNMGVRITRWVENSLLGGLPQYQLLKSMAEGLAQVESASGVMPALVSIAGGWQMGYLLDFSRERLGGRVFAAGADAHVRQRDVFSGHPGTTARHHDGPSYDDREAHRRRIGRGSSRHRPKATRRPIE